MTNRFKRLVLSASVLACFSSLPAQAFVYADSRLFIDNLTITGLDAATATITNFNFTATNTATLNGVSSPVQTATCGGLPGVPGALTNDCGLAPALNPPAANAPGGSAAATRASADFSFFGPLGGLQFSNAASIINQAQLTGDASTALRQIAESELQSGASASASAAIQSITGFTFTFTVNAPGSLSLSFAANPDQYAEISELLAGVFSAQSNLTTTFTLEQLSDPEGDPLQSATWAPRGTPGTNDCLVSNGLSCTESNDTQNLNGPVGTTANNTVAQRSHDGDLAFTLFGINIGGLVAGEYSLTLNATTSTQLSRRVVPVPEPATLMLVGAVLTGLGLARRRQKPSTAN